MSRWLGIGTTAALAMLGVLAGARTTFAHGHSGTTARQARQVVVEFFRSQNERRYERTCELLAPAFYAEHGLPDAPTCVALLRVGFMWTGRIEYHISRVEREGDRFTVRATANGAPGRIILVHDGGTFRIAGVVGE
jgi:hypothetical protein